MLQQMENLIYRLLYSYDRYDCRFVYQRKTNNMINGINRSSYTPVKNKPIVLIVQIFSTNGVRVSLLSVILTKE